MAGRLTDCSKERLEREDGHLRTMGVAVCLFRRTGWDYFMSRITPSATKFPRLIRKCWCCHQQMPRR